MSLEQTLWTFNEESDPGHGAGGSGFGTLCLRPPPAESMHHPAEAVLLLSTDLKNTRLEHAWALATTEADIQ